MTQITDSDREAADTYEASVHIDGLGWIKIKWDSPVTREHADLALLAAIKPQSTTAIAAAIRQIGE